MRPFRCDPARVLDRVVERDAAGEHGGGRDRLGIPNEIVGFVLPPGASLNKNGAAAYKAVTAVFIAQLTGSAWRAGQMLTIVLMATVAAFAGAGVPGSSLVTTLIVLDAIGLGPHAPRGIALVAAVDRPLDMCRTTVNTIGNSSARRGSRGASARRGSGRTSPRPGAGRYHLDRLGHPQPSGRRISRRR